MKSTLKTLKLLADPTRLRIINVLNEESLSVAELQEILGMGQSRISTQLAQLRQEGVVEDARSGKNVFPGRRSAQRSPESLRGIAGGGNG